MSEHERPADVTDGHHCHGRCSTSRTTARPAQSEQRQCHLTRLLHGLCGRGGSTGGGIYWHLGGTTGGGGGGSTGGGYQGSP